MTVTLDLIQINKKLTKFFSNDDAAMTVATHLVKYAKVNLIVGIPACILQAFTYSINTVITDDVTAAVVSIGFDVSCVGVAAG